MSQRKTVLQSRKVTADTAKANVSAAALLIGRFRRQRPLRGGSLIVTLFGDAIMPRGGAVALGSLIALAAPFGLNERLVRTATVRLAKDGWLEGRRAGKLSEYQSVARRPRAVRRGDEAHLQQTGFGMVRPLDTGRPAAHARGRAEGTAGRTDLAGFWRDSPPRYLLTPKSIRAR